MKKLWMIMLMLSLAGCASTGGGFGTIPQDYQWQDSSSMVFFSVTRDTDAKIVERLKIESQDSTFSESLSLRGTISETQDYDGKLFVIDLPAGEYVLTRLDLNRRWRGHIDLNAPFTVEAGEMHYLGNIRIEGKGLGTRRKKMGVNLVDRQERDSQELAKLYPTLVNSYSDTVGGKL